MSLKVMNNFLRQKIIKPVHATTPNFYLGNCITMVVSCFHLILHTPFVIKYDDNSGQYRCAEGSWLYKILSLLWQGFVSVHAIWGFTGSSMFEDSEQKIVHCIYQFTYLSYAVHHATWLSLMWHKLRQLPSILNKGNEIYGHLMKSEPSSEKCFLHTCIHSPLLRRLVVVLFFIFNIATHSAYILQGTTIVSDTSKQGLLMQFAEFVNKTANSLCKVQEYWCSQTDLEAGGFKFPAYVVGCFWFLICIMALLTTQFSCFILTFSAFYFKQLFLLGIKNIMRSSRNTEIFMATQTFIRITLLLDDFNKIFGTLLFNMLLTSVLYQCASLGSIIGGRMNGMAGNFMMVISVCPYYYMLIIMARVHKLGSTVPDLLKKKYMLHVQHANDDNVDDPISLEILHGSHILNHDVLANVVGFKGGDFFTISSSFLKNTVGVVATYTMVILQLSNK